MSDAAALRILDASLNRAAEGLRVAEDYVRFALDDGHLTGLLKSLRHDLASTGAALPFAQRHASRDTQGDVGTTISTPSEGERPEAWAVCQAALERTKQSLRSLEEYGKVSLPATAVQFESLRYRLYTIEAAIGRTTDAAGRLESVRLYVLVDGRESEQAFLALVSELVTAGVDAIQLRDKALDDRELIERGRLLVRTCRDEAFQPRALPGGSSSRPTTTTLRADPRAEPGADVDSVPLAIINDRPDIAAIVDADGVHLGQEDMRVKDARAILGPRKLIGVSCHSMEQARQAVLDGANYLGVGPTFPSSTKQFDAFPGLDLLRAVSDEIHLPAFAIGGISSANLPQVTTAGFQRVAVSSAVLDASSPADAVRSLRAVLSGG